ncbi:MAG: NUDIX domain-containing protein [Bauldia sp.]|uniref:NUDIX domain-containing protein n=1 Tax=Bauldia sp. TaxID=2575872 RepID=UPI001D4B83CD|nr:NUDIX domain-containing protein [Bauldia sp.]MCB1494538.1 NUDIX domain-containing protein [Bauldia sp.]
MTSWKNRQLVRAFLFYSRMSRGMTLGVRAAVFDDGGRVFLVRHSYVPGWYLPGGGVEPGETVEESLERELLEEAGIAVTGPSELFGMYLNRTASPRDHVALFVCRSWSQAAPPPRNLEIVDSGFHPVDRLPEDTTSGTRQRIAEIVGDSERSSEW